MSDRKQVKPPPLAPDLDRILWTAGGIARRLGCSPDFVRSVIANEPGNPIKTLGSRMYAVERDLIDWMRHRNPSQPT
ncbi:hypothetical protein [Mesorhizobium sp. B2-7-2]|uniref:hypothetical protein n=1 Tax=Mesorhizobium sp. B2-7-2 TaxID=2589908 RepID=UPI001127888A|nr:hypothetical protein [Mesorhizobium sp. B2-7-2]TPJ28027.1 hypothetical protein FJ425_13375 [Mesorhizobium sp. B2-7-2]